MTEETEKILKEVVNAHSRDIKKLVGIIDDLKHRLNKAEVRIGILELEKQRRSPSGDNGSGNMFKTFFGGNG